MRRPSGRPRTITSSTSRSAGSRAARRGSRPFPSDPVCGSRALGHVTHRSLSKGFCRWPTDRLVNLVQTPNQVLRWRTCPRAAVGDALVRQEPEEQSARGDCPQFRPQFSSNHAAPLSLRRRWWMVMKPRRTGPLITMTDQGSVDQALVRWLTTEVDFRLRGGGFALALPLRGGTGAFRGGELDLA